MRSILLCVISCCLAACSRAPVTHVLFIGNSYTFLNDGIDQHLKGLAPSTQTGLVAVGGATLKQHWDNSQTRDTIRSGHWDYVVLQEQSQTPVINAKTFHEGGELLNETIHTGHAQTILLMTWERPDSAKAGVTTEGLAKAYDDLGAELHAKVAPAGRAFARALAERPDLPLLIAADGHPTLAGTYLAACVVYRTIFGTKVSGNSYCAKGLASADCAFLQRIADLPLR